MSSNAEDLEIEREEIALWFENETTTMTRELAINERCYQAGYPVDIEEED